MESSHSNWQHHAQRPRTCRRDVVVAGDRYPDIDTTVTCDATVVEDFINEIRGNRVQSPNSAGMLVGLDSEWRILPPNEFGKKQFRIALLQLCVGHRCLVYQVHQARGRLPQVLNHFLQDEGHVFTGAAIGKDVERLEVDCGVRLSNPRDLQLIVPALDVNEYKNLAEPECLPSLDTLASAVLQIPHQKKKKQKKQQKKDDDSIDHHRWGDF